MDIINLKFAVCHSLSHFYYFPSLPRTISTAALILSQQNTYYKTYDRSSIKNYMLESLSQIQQPIQKLRRVSLWLVLNTMPFCASTKRRLSSKTIAFVTMLQHAIHVTSTQNLSRSFYSSHHPTIQLGKSLQPQAPHPLTYRITPIMQVPSLFYTFSQRISSPAERNNLSCPA